jgi:NAD+ kinase
MLVTPVAPHGLFDRTLVVPPDEEIVVRILPGQEAAALSADGGAGLPLSSGAEIHVRTGGRIKLAKVEPAPFWRLVREKFGLPPA